MKIPETTVACDGCGKELNLLGKFLAVAVKPQRRVLVVEEIPSDDPDEVSEPNIYLGSKKGRGVQKLFHNFACAGLWFEEREDWEPKMELVKEDEIYVPEDNRTPEELVEDGEMSAALATAISGGDE